MRRINHCLNRQLTEICRKVVLLEELNDKLIQFLPESLQAHCRAGSFNKGCLIIFLQNPVYATELRYCLPQLRDDLRKNGGFYNLISIKIQIEEALIQPGKDLRVKRSLSGTAQKSLYSAAALCSYEPLQKALQKFAGLTEELSRDDT